jgi:DNA-binding NarL/FixJ family response regulator
MAKEPPFPNDERCVSFVRVLVVEDYEPFRRFVCSTLEKRPELQVICGVSDGLEAVQKAEELQPDLVLLDIGLPTLNGIEVARRIRKLSPESKILFVSQESSADVVQEALSLGALGYVVKAHAGSELLAAVGAILQGEPFISRGLSGREFTVAADGQVPTLLPKKAEINRRHEVQFYSDDASFLVGLTCFVEAALEAGSAVIVVATEPHRNSLSQRLQAQGLNMGPAIERGRYIPLDAAESISTFMESGGPNRNRFLSTFGPLIRRAQTAAGVQHNRVVVFGEMVAVLCAEGKTEAAIELEQLWNELAQTHLFHLRCAYPITGELKGKPYASICAEHCVVLPANT